MTLMTSEDNIRDAERDRRPVRHDWVQADLRCMLCGRVLGRLVGALSTGDQGGVTPTAWRAEHFSAFRPSDHSLPAVRLTGHERFRCGACGGGAVVDEVETFCTYDDAVEDDDSDRPRRGRPPKPWRRAVDTRLLDLGLAG